MATRFFYHDGLNHYDREEWRDVDGFFGWVVVECNCKLETKMNKRQDCIEQLYEIRGDLMEDYAIASLNERPFYMQAELNEVIDQIKLVENITAEAHAEYFAPAPAQLGHKPYERGASIQRGIDNGTLDANGNPPPYSSFPRHTGKNWDNHEVHSYTWDGE